MTTSRHQVVYMPPLGREPGGFLDFLGLPPNAGEVEVARRAGGLRTKYDGEFRRARAELNQKGKAGEITEDERNEKVAALEEELSRKLEKLNMLKTGYDKQCAERRRMQKEGIVEDATAWVELLPSQPLTEAELLAMAARPRPLPKMDGPFVARLRQKWLGQQQAPENSIAVLPSDAAERGEPIDLALAAQLSEEQKLMVMLGADLIWGSFECTNRVVWEKQVKAWAKGAKSPVEPPNSGHPVSFPTLSTLANRTVEKLSAQEDADPALQVMDDPLADIRRMMENFQPLAPSPGQS